ncbi:MAG: RodZ domain-containing protein [Pseudomonadota bacterium]
MDDNDQPTDQATLFPKSTGDKLREAREAMGLDLSDVANVTRVPMRHLLAIEQGHYEGMPSPTYAIGFAKAYARVVGLDEKAIGLEVRGNPALPLAPATDYEPYELGDPKRLPSRGVAMAAGAIALVLLIGVIVYYGTSWLRGSGEQTALVVPAEAPTDAATPEATPAPVGGGQVILTATDSVWLRVYDATGKALFEKTMAPGEQYSVPADANNPMINIGRPDKLQVTLNGSAVAPLGDGKTAIKDVGISAAAIQARASGQPAPGATPAPAAAAPSTDRSTSVPPAFRPRPTASATPVPAPTANTVSPPGPAPTPAP